MASVLLTLSAPVVLCCRSMFHFDQPALLAYGLLLVVVRQLIKSSPDPRWYLVVLLVAAMSGRSAVALIFSLVWPFYRNIATRFSSLLLY